MGVAEGLRTGDGADVTDGVGLAGDTEGAGVPRAVEGRVAPGAPAAGVGDAGGRSVLGSTRRRSAASRRATPTAPAAVGNPSSSPTSRSTVRGITARG